MTDEERDGMPRWDADRLVIEKGWNTPDRCGRCGEVNLAIDALTRERDEAVEKVARLQLHVEMHEERATRAEHANRRLVERYHHLMPNHGTRPLLRDICHCGRDNLAAAEAQVAHYREALERISAENQAMREALTIIGRIHAHPARIARDALAALAPVADERTTE